MMGLLGWYFSQKQSTKDVFPLPLLPRRRILSFNSVRIDVLLGVSSAFQPVSPILWTCFIPVGTVNFIFVISFGALVPPRQG